MREIRTTMNVSSLTNILAIGSLAWLSLFSAGAAPKPDPFRFRATTLATGFERPVGMDLAPDGSIFLIELSGRVLRVDPETGAQSEVARIEVFAEQENGLIGIVLDPEFEKNKWIYLHYSPREYPGIHISRFDYQDGKLDMTSEKVLLKWETQRRECCHHAGMMLFGPDGNLYASTGDNTHPAGDSHGYAPIDRRPERGPWNAEKSSANPNDLRGGIIRIKPKRDGTYAIPDGNLFPPGTKGTRPELYVMGCRNPWKIGIDPKTGYLYWGEVGPDAGGDGERGPRGHDEINQARKAGFFGWPYFIADNQAYASVDMATNKIGAKFDPAKPINDSPHNTGRQELPPAQAAFLYWPYAKSSKFPELGNGGRTACAGPVFHDRKEYAENGLPTFYDNCLLFWDWHRPFIKWARLDKDSNFAGFENFMLPAGLTIKRLTNAHIAKDGSLYLLDYGSSWGVNKDSKLIRLSYHRGNLPPVATIKGVPSHGAVPLVLELDGSRSQDPEDKPLKYRWKVNGVAADAEGSKHSIELKKPADYNIELTVTDPGGEVSTTSTVVVAGNTPPVVKIVSPLDGSFYEPEKPVQFELEISDAEDGDSKESAATFATTVVTLAERERESPGLAAIRSSDCFNCHHSSQKLVGPAFTEIAKRYHGAKDAFEQSVQRVIKGSAKVWGPVPMLPHSQLKEDEVRAMVRWIYALKAEAAPQVGRGVRGTIVAPKGTASLELSANFTDAQRGEGSPLSGGATIRLHSRQVEAESFDAHSGPQIFSHGENETFLGGINHSHWVEYHRFRIVGSKSVTFRVASGGSGGRLRLHAGKTTLATLDVKPTGGWDKWQEITVPLEEIPEVPLGLRLAFTNPGKQGLLNVDWFRFDKK